MKVWLGSLLVLGVFGLQLISCQESGISPVKTSWRSVAKIWADAAEISHYALKQERYGQICEGEAVLIYVREPFLEYRQVKNESGTGDFQVLKLNTLRTFLSGVYPYNIMESVFQPLKEETTGSALKATTSIQEWCGHVFMQTNRRDGHLKTGVQSYFMKDDGTTFDDHAAVLMEEEIWTSLRLDPSGLPVGPITLRPSGLSSRLSHRKLMAERATARWLQGETAKTVIYEITYAETGRTLAIEIQKKLPYAIESWKETKGEALLSSGTLIKRATNVDYWNYNKNPSGAKLRSTLGLPTE